MSVHSAITEQPDKLTSTPSTPMAQEHARNVWNISGRIKHAHQKLTTRRGWLGDYDYAWLCMPSLPWKRKGKRNAPPFYALDSELPLILAAASGLQHALAMLAGLITPPIVIAGSLSLDTETSAYMISASLIGSGILSLVQMSRIRLFGGYYLGTGLLAVVGTSFASVSTANAVFDALYADGTCPSTTEDGVVTRGACPDAYGLFLGTSLVCAFLEIFISFIPARILKRVFPPIVTGTVIVMVGASLVGSSGIANWGGGSNNCMHRPPSGPFQLCPSTVAPHPLPWGSPEFIGLGFLSFICIILTGDVWVALLEERIGAAGYIDGSSIQSAPVVTFIWVHTFKLRVYPPAILPVLAVYVALAMEAIGDIAASAEVSRLPVVGEEFDSRVQGGLLGDGIGGFVSALLTISPLSNFAQNNGVIAVTRCANRTAGKFCCVFLILFGILGKISGVFLAIPNPVLGGVTTFLFASVVVSGLRILSYTRFTRRERFVLGASLSFGIGDLVVPEIFTHLFDGVDQSSTGLRSLFSSITIVLDTPFLISGLVALVLNLILPEESDDYGVVDVEMSLAQPHGKDIDARPHECTPLPRDV